MRHLLTYFIRVVIVIGLLMPSIASAQTTVFLPVVATDGEAAEQEAAAADQESFTAANAELPPGKVFTIAPGQAKKEQHEEAELDLGGDAVTTTLAISMTALAEEHLPALSQGMTNVTKGPRSGYRFLPHMKFANKIKVRMPYHERLIPPGMTEQDIRTYYFDEPTGTWLPLERVELDTRNKVITSYTDHFTDMINAVVTVPDHPQPMSFDPNSIQDIKLANPATGIDLINVPTGSFRGDAQISYPIQLPPGRNGVQPSLTLAYNSSSSNGWVGLGWAVNTIAVTVDSRWGVPRYDPDYETETYLLSGGQLTPVAHRSAFVARESEKVFNARVEGSFRRIIRHGDHPNNYWWEVVEKNGTRMIFGDTPETRLTNADGDVFQWMLRDMRDPNGNGVAYTYAHVDHAGVADSTALGTQIYPKTINYTQNNGSAGAYTVEFKRDRELGLPQRPDVMIDARGGFKQVTADLLKEIIITFDDGSGPAVVRKYTLEYVEGAFRKKLLQSIAMQGASGTELHRHAFDYFDEIRNEGSYIGFEAASDWNTRSDNVKADILGYDIGAASALGGSINDSVGVHLYAGFNIASPTKQFSIGGKIGGVDSDTEGVLSLVDINGDNLPDKVFKIEENDEDKVYFRLNESGPDGNPVFSETRTEIPTLTSFFRESSSTLSAGPETYIVVASFQLNFAETFSTNSVYFSDVNADGLVDLVTGGQVQFNRLVNGVPTFQPDSEGTPAPIANGSIHADGLIQDYTDIFEQAVDQFPLHDTVRRWTAPFAGTIQITGDVALIEDTSQARSQYQTADGVRVAIQHNGSELWSTPIDATDYGNKTPLNVAEIPVQKGDRIYFRVGSIFDGAFDQVAWNPQIQYIVGSGDPTPLDPAPDANGLDQYLYRADQDFALVGRRDIFVQMSLTGTLQLTGTLEKLDVTSDDLIVQAFHNSGLVFSQTLTGSQVVDITPSAVLNVVPEDTVRLRIVAESPIDATQVRWTPDLFYTETSSDSTLFDNEGNPLFRFYPPYDLDIYPVSNLNTPLQPFVATADGSYSVQTDVAVINPPAPNGTGMVVFTVKRNGQLVEKAHIEVVNGVVNNTSVSFNAAADDQFYFEYSVYDPLFGLTITDANVQVTAPGATGPVPAPSALYRAVLPGAFAQPYRGWAYAGYNGNREFADQALVESRLVQDFDNEQSYDPASATVYLFNPIPSQEKWRGPDDGGYVQAALMSSSRLGPDAISVPSSDGLGGQRAVARISRTSQEAGLVGALGATYSESGLGADDGSYSELDYLDMNGDHYPDIVGNGRIQYTTPDGGLETYNEEIAGLGLVRESDAGASTFGIGGSVPLFKSGGKGVVDGPGYNKPGENTTGNQMVSLGLGIGISIGEGNSEVFSDLQDINGDGLPDRVTRDANGNLIVSLNLGYTFGPPENWGQGTIHKGENENRALSLNLGILGVNDGIYGFAGGLSVNRAESETNATLQDINGDGLLDRVRPDAAGIAVALNTGAGFDPEFIWPGALAEVDVTEYDETFPFTPDPVLATDSNNGVGGGVYFTIGIGPLCLFSCYVIINPGADASLSISRPEVGLRDVDGDGYPDHVRSSTDGLMEVALNPIGKTNLLKTVHRPLGATIDIQYARDGNTEDLPQSRWVMSEVRVYDGHPGDGVDETLTTYQYAGGYYDRQEREFFGYANVTEEQRNANSGDLYRSMVSTYATDSYYKQGLLIGYQTLDANGMRFRETEHTYALYDVLLAAPAVDPTSTTATIFPQLVRTDERFFEGEVTPDVKSTYRTMQYDALGNVIQLFEAGDTPSADDLTATFAYAGEFNTYSGPQAIVSDPALCQANHIRGTATQIIVTAEVNGAAQVVRHREAAVDCATGNMVQVRKYLANGDGSITDIAYNANGTIMYVEGPENGNVPAQRYRVDLEFDPVVQTHITKVTDSYAYVSTASYDLRFGSVTNNTDINGNSVSYTFDEFGRTQTVVGPYEQGTGQITINFEYHPEAAVPYAISRHLDPYRDVNDTLDTVVFVDGMGRQIQRKRDTTIHTGPDTDPVDAMTVSGRTTFDLVGRIHEDYHPIVEPLGTADIFNTDYDTLSPTIFEYDVEDRIVSTTAPDGTTITSIYGFGNDRDGNIQFETKIIDANVNANFLGNETREYHDVRRMSVGTRRCEANTDCLGQSVWTSFTYDALQQLVRIVDDGNNVTSFAYDNFGRRTAVDNPDTGLTEFVYDLASNQIAKITPNLRLEGKQIDYVYDFDQLRQIVYPDFPENNVTYTYGEAGADFNRAGQITLVTDGSGSEERFYGKLGEVIKEVNTVNSATEGNSTDAPEVYTTEYVYDTWNRLQKLTYPDGEVLTYQYDSGGRVRAASGVKDEYTYAYMNRMEYDRFDQRVFTEMGNNVRTSFTYSPTTRLLVHLQSGKGDGNPFQDQTYTYDPMGNVLAVGNDIPVPASPSKMNGPVHQSYGYDYLYRLVSASGTHYFGGEKIDRYTMNVAYDNLHNFVSKDQLHEIVQPSSTPILQQRTSYDFDYVYGGAQPHAVTNVGGRTFQYDANGNQIGYTNDANGTGRTIVWDEENRIHSLSDNGHEQTYRYNADGERIIKRGPEGEAAYVNSFFTIRNREVGVKHVFIGSTRYVTKLMKQDKPGGNGNGGTPLEKDLYFYHPDHLGGTQYVTDATGQLYEHTEYFPFGETWIVDAAHSPHTPYLFTGKELDEETGLYYYGARYYDPRVGSFLSTDPYTVERPEEMLREMKLTNSYGYALQNPLKYIDPDGRSPITNIVRLWELKENLEQVNAAVEGFEMGMNGQLYNPGPGAVLDGFPPGTDADDNLMKLAVNRLAYTKYLENQRVHIRNRGKLTPEQRAARLRRWRKNTIASMRKLSIQMSYGIKKGEALLEDLEFERSALRTTVETYDDLTESEMDQLEAQYNEVEGVIDETNATVDKMRAWRNWANNRRRVLERTKVVVDGEKVMLKPD